MLSHACLCPVPLQDLSLAQHVLTVHREGRPPPPTGAAPLPPEMLRAYIAAAKQHEPFVPDSLADYVAAVYAEMRAEEAAADVPHSYTTARTLLSILRLAQALARLRFADSVEQVGLGARKQGYGALMECLVLLVFLSLLFAQHRMLLCATSEQPRSTHQQCHLPLPRLFRATLTRRCAC
jgi:hypothetical protein